MGTAARPWGKFDNQMAACVRIAMSEETPPVPEKLSAICRDPVECCLRREPTVRLSASQLLLHDFVHAMCEGAAARRDHQEYLDTAPNYNTIKDLLPGYLE